jgi:UrcA family protein
MRTSARLVVTFSALSLLVGSAAAVAAPSTDNVVVTTKVVRFKDLDIATGAGAETLYERIAAAARVVCRGAPQAEVRTCRSTAVDDAVRAVSSPLLSSIHRSASGRVAEVVRR